MRGPHGPLPKRRLAVLKQADDVPLWRIPAGHWPQWCAFIRGHREDSLAVLGLGDVLAIADQADDLGTQRPPAPNEGTIGQPHS